MDSVKNCERNEMTSKAHRLQAIDMIFVLSTWANNLISKEFIYNSKRTHFTITM